MMNNSTDDINVFTDGSCNHIYKIGGWAAIVLINEREILLQDKELDTTHNRMELLAVIKALEFIDEQNLSHHRIIIYSDSQYVVRIIERKDKLKTANFITKKGSLIQNKDFRYRGTRPVPLRGIP